MLVAAVLEDGGKDLAVTVMIALGLGKSEMMFCWNRKRQNGICSAQYRDGSRRKACPARWRMCKRKEKSAGNEGLENTTNHHTCCGGVQ